MLLKASGAVPNPLPAAAGRMQWMFGLPLQVDGRHGLVEQYPGAARNGVTSTEGGHTILSFAFVKGDDNERRPD